MLLYVHFYLRAIKPWYTSLMTRTPEERNMKTDEAIDYDQYLDIKEALIGRTVTDIDTKTKVITLDNGATLLFEDTGSCCAWYDVELKAGNFRENVITHVRYTDNSKTSEYEADVTITVLSKNEKIVDINAYGDEGTGYYMHTIDIDIFTP